MIKIMSAMPKTAWLDASGKMKSDGDLTTILNNVHMLSGSTVYSPDASTLGDLKKFIASIP
jgi:hypothetical protein